MPGGRRTAIAPSAAVVAVLLLALLAACTPAAGPPRSGGVPTASPVPPTGQPASTAAPTASAAPAPVRTGAGVSAEPCPDARDRSTGCITLGVVGDLTRHEGAVAALEAFWDAADADGAIPGFEVDLRRSDAGPDGQAAAAAHDLLQEEVLAHAALVGGAAVEAVAPLLSRDGMAAVPLPGSRSSWLLAPELLEVGSPACADAMNVVDHLVDAGAEVGQLAVVVPPATAEEGGRPVVDPALVEDAVAGARLWGAAAGAVVSVAPADAAGDLARRLRLAPPDAVLVVGAGPAVAAVAEDVAAQGVPLLLTAAAHRLLADGGLVLEPGDALVVGPWEGPQAGTAGHEALRGALRGLPAPLDVAHVGGWVAGAPLLALLRQAALEGDLTREGLRAAATRVVAVDTAGILPPEYGNLAGLPDGAVVRSSAISRPDGDGGLVTADAAFRGPTATDHRFASPCPS